jgi:hypothetical protein
MAPCFSEAQSEAAATCPSFCFIKQLYKQVSWDGEYVQRRGIGA